MSEQSVSNSLGQLRKLNINAQPGQDVIITCPDCGCKIPYKVLRIGNAIIACKECKVPLLLRIQQPLAPSHSMVSSTAQPVATAQPNPKPIAPVFQNASLLGLAHPTDDGNFVINEHAVLGVPVRIKCGKCGKMHLLTPSKAGIKSISCASCSSTIIFSVDAPAAQSPIKVATTKKEATEPQMTVALRDHNKQQSMGAISFGGFWGIKRKIIRLRVGQNTIGRIDNEKPSSISFNDNFMSRQSVMIDVMPADDARAGYRFLFRVMNAANPVYVNKQQYAVGDSVYLNYGDTIRLGRTTVRFVRVK